MPEDNKEESQGLTPEEELVAEDSYQHYECSLCKDTGYLTVGEFDDIDTVACPECNPKLSVEEQMDDDS